MKKAGRKLKNAFSGRGKAGRDPEALKGKPKVEDYIGQEDALNKYRTDDANNLKGNLREALPFF
jgi:hypothetical protein